MTCLTITSSAISRAAGILSARKKSLKRGVRTKSPYTLKPQLISCYGFKVSNNTLGVPVAKRECFEIPLNKYTQHVLSSDPDLNIRSFTLTPTTVSISYSKAVGETNCTSAAGIDRNLRNVTYGNFKEIVQYDLSQAAEIAESTNDVVKSFRRNDNRIRRKLVSKYGKRRKNRINHILHNVSKNIMDRSLVKEQAIVFENITNIRRMYRRGNGQGRDYRRRLNAWPFGEIKRQIEYKAKWLGIPVIQLSVKDTQHTSTLCPQCGERLQGAKRDDKLHRRQLWCLSCKRWLDRDVVAAMNQSLKGWMMFAHSKGVAHEAMRGNLEEYLPVILRVDATKPSQLTVKAVANCPNGLDRTKIKSGLFP